MVAAKAKFQARDHENEQPNARKRHCNKGALALGCNSVWQAGDPAAEFLHQFNLAQGLCSPEQPINDLVWRCWAEFNVHRSATSPSYLHPDMSATSWLRHCTDPSQAVWKTAKHFLQHRRQTRRA